jgi:hypothetical protein
VRPGAPLDDDRRLFRVCAGDRVQHVQPAHAVRHANQADAVDARVRVGGEAGAGFVRHRDRFDLRLLQPREGRQGEVPRHAETVPHAAAVEVLEEELAHRHARRQVAALRSCFAAGVAVAPRTNCGGIGRGLIG